MPLKERTLALHAGRGARSKSRPMTGPIHVSAVNYFEEAQDLDDSMGGRDFVYGRLGAQNAVQLEGVLAELEGAPSCACFSSGMAALRAVFDAQHFKPGEAMAMLSDGYGTTRALFKQLAAERGVALHAFPMQSGDAPERIRALRPRLVLAESMTNPLLRVPDLSLLAGACRSAAAALAVDATFVTPAIQRPCELGADYTVQSTTKWINGHSDAIGGAVSGSAERIEPLRAARNLQGSILGPFEAWLTERGARTLFVRMQGHGENAAHVARRLRTCPKLERVHYPGLADHPDYAVARQVLQGGFGGMVAFEIRNAGRAQAFRFLESVQVAKPAPSLGDVATLVMHAASGAARNLSPEERERAGIGENLIRVSVGLEDPDDIADDLLQAIDRALE